jgi:hypothetical protein
MAPLGNPVVPDVYWICATSSGVGSGSACAGSPESRNAAQSVNDTTSRRWGSSPRTACSDSAMGLPRNSGVRNTPAALDWRST